MEIENTDIIEASGKIIVKSGLNALSIKELATEMGITEVKLFPYFEKEDDILILMLISLKNEINELINNPTTSGWTPENKLQYLFRNLHKLFSKKPYYLTIIFATELTEKDVSLQKLLLKIKVNAKIHLTQIIDQGKEEHNFKTNQTTRNLVDNILGSFRDFMNEYRTINKMVKDIAKLRELRE